MLLRHPVCYEYISLQNSRDNDVEDGGTIEWVNHCFPVFLKHHYRDSNFFEKLYSISICSIFFPVYGIKCSWEIWEQQRFF